MATTPEEIPPPKNTTVSSSDNDVMMGDAVAVAEKQKVEEYVNKEKGEDLSHLQNHLEVLLKLAEVDFKGTFSFHKTYTDAPNPGLRLSDLGTVGLPLSVREADAVKSKCELAPFGKGERTLIDKTVRDTWQMNATEVKFTHPQWNKFLSRVVKEVCETLGVNFEASQPRCELHKLLLYETGSHFLPHVDTEKQDGMFATVVVVLPSEFTGGAAHLSHGKLSKEYDCSATSQHDTNVLAWYTDVTHEIKPITSGYRLALSFNLVHTTTFLRPALTRDEDLVARLRDRLVAWKASRGLRSPEKLIYLLDHTYSQANLRASALKGVDAHKVAMLDPIANELGFRLGLASIECYQYGGATEDRDNPEFAYVEENTMSITCFKDMGGELIRKTLDFDEETETIPSDLTASIEKGKVHGEELHGGYQGNEAGQLERWYRRSVLVIWPSWSKYTVQYGEKKALSYALVDLKNITTASRSSDERELIDFTLSRCSEDPTTAAPILTDMSLLLDDVKLWDRVVKTCCVTDGLRILSDEKIQRAVKHFGLEAVRPGLEEMLIKDTRNKSRFTFLDNLQEWTKGLADDSPDKAALQQWYTLSMTRVLNTLKPPQEAEQQLLISVAAKHGGVEYLKDHMLPQLVSIADSTFLREFATSVHQSTVFPDSEAKSTVVSSLLAAAISRGCFFKSTSADRSTEYLDLAKVYIKTVRELGYSHMVNDIIDRVTDTSKLDDRHAQECARKVMIPLVVFLGETSSQSPNGSDLPTHFLQLQQEGIKLYLGWLLDKGQYRTPEQDTFKTLVNAGLVTGDAEVFANSVHSFLEGKDLNVKALQKLIDEVEANRDRLVSSGLDDSSVQSLIGALAASTAFSQSVSYINHVISALDWCMTMNIPNLWNIVIEQFISGVERMGSTYLEQWIAPYLPKLQEWGLKHQKDVSLAIQKVLTVWIEKVLGTAPTASSYMVNQLAGLAKWTCSCETCPRVRKFLTTSNHATKDSFYDGESPHTEQYLAMHAQNLATWTSGRSFTITKSDELLKLLQWRKFQPQAVALLKALRADGGDLRDTLGPQYERVMAALAEPSVEQTSASTASANPSSNLRAESNNEQQADSTSTITGPPAKKRKLDADVP